MFPFHLLFPEIGIDETRTLTLREPIDNVPAGDYGFVECYCVEPNCDCHQVLLKVLKRDHGEVATISHALRPRLSRSSLGVDLPRTYIDPLHPCAPYAPQLMALFEDLMLSDRAYCERLERHYKMVREAIATPGHPIHARIPGQADTRRALRRQAQALRAARRREARRHRRSR